MKKQNSLFFVLCCLVMTGCLHFHHRDTTISFKESTHFFSMKAWYDPDKTREVERFLDKELGGRGRPSFVNTKIDGQLTYDDHTSFYIKKNSGFLLIRLDKDQNSGEAYAKMKDMCEGIKDVLGK